MTTLQSTCISCATARVLAILGVALLIPATALAVPTIVIHNDLPECDPLVVPQLVDELGLAPVFPTDELISADATFSQQFACPDDNPEIPNALVVMTNLSPTAWAHVWYVGDPPNASGGGGTTLSNFDGVVDGISPVPRPGLAFKIDAVGINRPLIFESIAADGIFAPGEIWHFLIDDYINGAGLPPSLFDSIGVGSLSAGGPPSSGSIIAVPVPEPTGLVLLLVGGTLVAALRTRFSRVAGA
jgi:hypothetical protein